MPTDVDLGFIDIPVSQEFVDDCAHMMDELSSIAEMAATKMGGEIVEFVGSAPGETPATLIYRWSMRRIEEAHD